MKAKQYIFFLGGYDAEMCEIRKILEERKQVFYDHRLQWGAKLSDYEDDLKSLSNSAVPVFIELDLDIGVPEKSIIIDHHNQNAGKEKKSSIEQVAELLNIHLNRWQQLIAANDIAWINGLVAAGATKKEIAEIRKYDRICQGVSEEAEQQAEDAIRRMVNVDSLAIVEIPHPHASAVMDRLYMDWENILVFSPNETNFSGRGDIIKALSESFPDSWYGGELPVKGFWGMKARNKKAKQIILSYLQED